MLDVRVPRGLAAALAILAVALAACQGERYGSGYGAPTAYDGHYGAARQCGQWPVDLSTDWQNRPYANFGCATENNLAAMVEDPRDLHGPRAVTPRDSERRDDVFEKYRAGEDTSAQSGTDDAEMIGEAGN